MRTGLRSAGVRRRARRTGPAAALLLGAALAAAVPPAPAAAQQPPASLRLAGPDGEAAVVGVERHRGYAAVPAATLARLGWRLDATPTAVRATADDAALDVRAGDPFFRWNGALLQLVDEPYAFGDGLWVPLQLLVDFLPAHLPEGFAFDAGAATLRVREGAFWTPASPGSAAGPRTPAPSTAAAPAAGERSAGSAASAAEPGPAVSATPPGPRLVFIDAGHGGRDPGSIGPSGVREKDVALAVALALAEELRGRPGIEVRLIRDDDRLVPLWERGEIATRAKGTRPGIYVSLHTNAVDRRDARGFETYFLSEARTDHERRVAALENAPLRLEAGEDPLTADPALDFILRELRNFDHAHWSSLLAEMIQDEMRPFHPGPDRGVKQAPLAVITNALMPAVLVELGFITNREEERLLARPSFHRDAAKALAAAVEDFFRRYPPGGTSSAGGRP